MRRAAAILVFCFVAAQFWLAFTRSINWDEFHFLAQVHEFTRGTLDLPLQTLHVVMFEWLAQSELFAVDQIVRGRLVMFAAFLGTCGAIAAVAMRFTDRTGALLCVLAYTSFGYVLQHGSAFRTDPLAAFLCMSGLAILARSRLTPATVVLTAFILGVAFMVTIKIVLYLSAFAGIAWLRWSEKGFALRRAAELALIPVLALLVAVAIFLLHSAGLKTGGGAAGVIGNAGATMFGLSPNLAYSARAVILNIPFVACFVLALGAVARGDADGRAERIALAGLASPALCLVFYTNTFPYFFAFIVPPLATALAAAIAPLRQRFGLLPTALAMAVFGAFTFFGEGPSTQDKQRRIEQAVNTMFPEPIAYFDFPGFLPRHDKANFFMTDWGLKKYEAAGRAHFVEVMDSRAVPVLLAVEPEFNPTLAAVMKGGERSAAFHPDDVAALRESYRRAWGPLYLAGTSLEAGETRSWHVRVPGTYTVQGALTVDGQLNAAGSIIRLERGTVSLSAGKDAPAGLIWGDRLPLPPDPAPMRPYWTDF